MAKKRQKVWAIRTSGSVGGRASRSSLTAASVLGSSAAAAVEVGWSFLRCSGGVGGRASASLATVVAAGGGVVGCAFVLTSLGMAVEVTSDLWVAGRALVAACVAPTALAPGAGAPLLLSWHVLSAASAHTTAVNRTIISLAFPSSLYLSSSLSRSLQQAGLSLVKMLCALARSLTGGPMANIAVLHDKSFCLSAAAAKQTAFLPFEDAHDICFNYLGWGWGIQRWVGGFQLFLQRAWRESYARARCSQGSLSISVLHFLFQSNLLTQKTIFFLIGLAASFKYTFINELNK